MRSGAVANEGIVTQSGDKRSLSYVSFAKQQDFRLVLRHGVFKASKVRYNSVSASSCNLRKWLSKWILSKFKF